MLPYCLNQIAMTKIAIFKIENGTFKRGFAISLQIVDEGVGVFLKTSGRLPPAPNIPQLYHSWQSDFIKLQHFRRIKHGKTRVYSSIKDTKTCKSSAFILNSFFCFWLNSSSLQWQQIRKELFNSLLAPGEEIRFFIQTNNFLLKKLPWHEWDIFDKQFLNAEIALAAPEYSRVKPLRERVPKERVRILGIFGDSTGINTQPDRKEIQRLPNVELNFPQLSDPVQLQDSLRSDRGWDILFFAGHSLSSKTGETGTLYITEDYGLTIAEFKKALTKAIRLGLQLAIFNSCDGLGLATELADLDIPQVIVMREPVPDEVAQSFIKTFLERFSQGNSLYLSMRQARDQLKNWENQYPGVRGLPIICQNPAQMPTVWPQVARRKTNNNTLSWCLDSVKKQETWQCVHTLTGHSDGVKSVAINPSGTIIASGSYDRTIKLWDLPAGKLLNTLAGHSGTVTCVGFSPDGTLASSSFFPDGTIKLWERDNAQPKMTLRGDDWFGLAVWTIAFSADGKFLASGHNLDRTIKIWDLDKGKQIRTLRGHYSAVCAVTFNPLDRSIISSGFDGTIKIWNWENGQGFHTLYGPSSWLNSVKYWWLNRDESIYAMTLSSDGQILASGGSQDWINIWSLGNRQLHNTLKGHSDSVQCVAIAPNGKILASGSDDKTIKIWDITTGTLLHTLGHADRVNTVAFGPDGQTLISGSQDKTIKIWRLMRLMSNEF